MKRHKWQILLGISLLLASVCLYLVHYAIFRDPHHIFIYLLGDIAFLPVEVLLVTLIIDGLLASREKSARIEKLNMVIGAFFSEAGTRLLACLSDLDPRLDEIRGSLVVTGDWSEREFASVVRRLKNHEYEIDVRGPNLAGLRDLLVGRRDFLLRLLENPNLLEHESFTDLLWAVFHLTEELASRPGVSDLPAADLQHLAGDSKRAYSALAREWLAYMKHLRGSYPYLFSLAMRTNPFDQNASVIFT